MITKCDKKSKLVKILPSKSAEKQSHPKNLDKISNRSHKSLSTKNIQKESEVDDRFDATIVNRIFLHSFHFHEQRWVNMKEE